MEWLIYFIIILLITWLIKRLWIYKLGMICLTYYITKKLGKENVPKDEELKTLFSLALDEYIDTMKRKGNLWIP